MRESPVYMLYLLANILYREIYRQAHFQLQRIIIHEKNVNYFALLVHMTMTAT